MAITNTLLRGRNLTFCVFVYAISVFYDKAFLFVWTFFIKWPTLWPLTYTKSHIGNDTVVEVRENRGNVNCNTKVCEIQSKDKYYHQTLKHEESM